MQENDYPYFVVRMSSSKYQKIKVPGDITFKQSIAKAKEIVSKSGLKCFLVWSKGECYNFGFKYASEISGKDSDKDKKHCRFFEDLEEYKKDARLKDKLFIASEGVKCICMHSFYCTWEKCVNNGDHFYGYIGPYQIDFLKDDEIIELVNWLGSKVVFISPVTPYHPTLFKQKQFAEVLNKMEYVIIAQSYIWLTGYIGLELHKVEKDGSHKFVKGFQPSTRKNREFYT